MSNIDYLKIIALIGAVITFIVTYFKKEQNKYVKLVDDYFKKVLIQYVDLYNKDNKINSVEFIKDNYSMKDYYIPSYIFYLVNMNKKIDLHKVLLEDYRERFPNNRNAIFKTIDKLVYTYSLIQVFIYCFLFAVPIFSIALIVLLIGKEIITGVGNGFKEETWSSILGLIIIGIFAVAVIIVFKWLAKHIAKGMKDEYTMKISEMEELVKNKVKDYDETINKYYLI